MSFRLAPMCRLMRGLTLLLLALPIIFLATAIYAPSVLEVPAILLVAIYAWVWLRFRPNRFVVHPSVLEVIWPLKRREIPRASISSIRLIDKATLRREAGRGLRVGAGGLWGGFRMAVDSAARNRSDVRLADRRLRVDRARQRPTVAHHARTAGSVRACSIALALTRQGFSRACRSRIRRTSSTVSA